MVLSDSANGLSLLPYLNARSEGIFIQFNFPEQKISVRDDAGTEPSGAFTTLRYGHVVIDRRCRLKDVIFVNQSDIYSIDHSELKPFTNLDVERVWQQTWAQIKNLDAEGGPIVMPCQIGEDGTLTPFRSLFYCLHKDRYCHPLCPVCGSALVLCRDDDLLSKAGIPTFSGSLQRYLYCPDCHQNSEESCFYARTLKGDPSFRVKDCHGLIEAFSGLLTKSDLSGQLPCIGCDEAVHCYGPPTLALRRMQALQFYPFHMLMQHAPTLNALEFVALLSGAGAEDIGQQGVKHQKGLQPNRFRKISAKFSNGTGFLFEKEGRLFLEILYLKLSFLHEVILLINSDACAPVNRMSLEGIGVFIQDRGARLPYLWNFALKLVDPIGRPAPHPPGSIIPDALTREFLGYTWFYVLLVNGTQQMSHINAVIEQLLAQDVGQGDIKQELLKNTIFEPGHIFWLPRSLEPEPKWHELWIEALEMGITLLRAAMDSGSDFSNSTFEYQLEGLKGRVHQLLFKAPVKVQRPASETYSDSNPRIAAILTDILGQWAQAASPSKRDATFAGQWPPMDQPHHNQVNEDGDYAETVILSEDELGKLLGVPESPEITSEIEETQVKSPPAANGPGKGAADDLEKTVVVGTSQPPEHSRPPSDGELDETGVITPRSRIKAEDDADKTMVTAPKAEPSPDSDLDETVVLKPPQKPADQEDLDKTVLIKPSAGPSSPKDNSLMAKITNAVQSNKPAEDELKETVIIHPKKDRNGKPEP